MTFSNKKKQQLKRLLLKRLNQIPELKDDKPVPFQVLNRNGSPKVKEISKIEISNGKPELKTEQIPVLLYRNMKKSFIKKLLKSGSESIVNMVTTSLSDDAIKEMMKAVGR